jgi:Right handed beta helix region
MLSASSFRRLTTGSPTRSRRPRSRPTLSRRALLPQLEGLEGRSLLSTFTVTNLLDSGANSLRAAILSGDDTIDFAKGLHGTITLTGELPITNSVTINGPGANMLSVSGNNSSRVFDISGSASASIAGLAISEGRAASGGGILLEDSAALRISNCTLSDNEALGTAAGGGFGGGIEDDSPGALTVTNSTFVNDEAIGVGPNNTLTKGYILALGGAIDVSYDSTSPVTISNSTFTGNQARGGSPGASAGGGVLKNGP